jgi:hypothetical protein
LSKAIKPEVSIKESLIFRVDSGLILAKAYKQLPLFIVAFGLKFSARESVQPEIWP